MKCVKCKTFIIKNDAKHKKAYRAGYNNPNSFNQDELLKSNDDLAKAVIAGICQRKTDDQAGTAKFKP